MSFPTHVTLVEVAPRDGLQNEFANIPTEIKIKFINALSKTGLTVIESTSFVSPQWVPQMADHCEVMQKIEKVSGVQYPALVPNFKGLEKAIACGATAIAVFTAASETFSRKNTNCSIEESLQRITEVIVVAKQHHIPVRGYVSCALGCPYEGEINPKAVATLAKQLFDLGCYEISLGDTIGVGTAQKAQRLIQLVSQQVPVKNLALHFHDTYGQALANIYACLELGIGTIDSSVAGLGGCPYAPGAGGNVATEDVLYMLNGLNIKTGVDIKKIMQAAQIILDHTQQKTRSKVANALAHDK